MAETVPAIQASTPDQTAVAAAAAVLADPNKVTEKAQLVAMVNEKFNTWREQRRPYEMQWFVNSALLNGNHDVAWNDALGRLEARPVPAHRVRLRINRILPKIRARIAKFTRNRPIPVVIPASTDRDDRINARATQKVLAYLQRKLQTELKYKETLMWSQQCGKGFWWLRWNKDAIGRVKFVDEMGQEQIQEGQVGDVELEVGSPFEVFVGDMGVMRLGDQPEIIRAKMRRVDEVKARFPEHASAIRGEAAPGDIFQYERQIAALGSRQRGVATQDKAPTEQGQLTHVCVKEYFCRPTMSWPQGRYLVVCNDQLLNEPDAPLPLGFSNMMNPFPGVEFPDMEIAGRFWPTTHIEQMAGLQEEYNHLRSRLAEHIRMMIFPKLLVPEQFRMSRDGWSAEAGQIVRYLAMPGIPAPQPWHPPNISNDAWKMVDTLKAEFDDVSNIFPAMQGAVGQASSGFQTNLLQEAADSVHAPDIRVHEIAMEDAAMKMRRIVKQGYDIPRIVAVTGKGYEPDVFEFSADQVDENADIVIQSGSALSQSPATRSQQVFELFNSGLLGDPALPETRRTALGLLSLNTQEEIQEMAHRDEEQARLETLEAERGFPLNSPMPWENHDVHWSIHTDEMKSPAFRNWTQDKQEQLIRHTILHGRYINPDAARSIAEEFGFTDLLALFPPPAPPPMPGTPVQEPAPGGAPPPPPQAEPAADAPTPALAA